VVSELGCEPGSGHGSAALDFKALPHSPGVIDEREDEDEVEDENEVEDEDEDRTERYRQTGELRRLRPMARGGSQRRLRASLSASASPSVSGSGQCASASTSSPAYDSESIGHTYDGSDASKVDMAVGAGGEMAVGVVSVSGGAGADVVVGRWSVESEKNDGEDDVKVHEDSIGREDEDKRSACGLLSLASDECDEAHDKEDREDRHDYCQGEGEGDLIDGGKGKGRAAIAVSISRSHTAEDIGDFDDAVVPIESLDVDLQFDDPTHPSTDRGDARASGGDGGDGNGVYASMGVRSGEAAVGVDVDKAA